MPQPANDSAWHEDVAVAAVALQPFVILLAATFLLHGISAQQLAAADPLIQRLGPAGYPALILVCLGLGGGWWIAVRPHRPALQRGLRQGLAALVTVALGMPLVRLVIGPSLPAFLPPEESSAPGLVGGLGAGVFEEALFRLVMLPVLLAASRRFLRSTFARYAIASLVVGLAFAIAHELGPPAPGAEPLDPVFFLDRVAMPGFLMSMGCRWPGFTFVVTLHCAAHVLLPFLFV